jgi:calcium-dependent protein kinase
VFERIKAGQPPSFDYEPWPDISEEAKACVRRMLKHSPSDRATADEILTDPWMQRNGVASDKPLGSAVGDRIRKFVALNKLKREAIRMMAASMAPEEVAGLRELFSAADVNDDGTISVLELRDIMQKPGYAGIGEESSILASVEKLNALLNEADVDGSGNLDLEEFIAATVHTSKLYKEEKLRDTFDKFDVDGSGVLSREEIKAALNERGLNEAGLQGIFEEVDTNNDGKVDYDEFCSLMRAGDPVCSGTGMRSSIRFSFTSD